VAQTVNFHILHRGDAEYAGRVARTAERTRETMSRQWFGKAPPAWARPCDIYLYPTAREYFEQTGAPPASPGHTRVQDDDGRVVSREIHLHGQGELLLRTVLPHEVTHAVLAGHFGAHRIPRWADEGVAVLSEPREQVAEHLRDLSRWRDDGALFGARELVEMQDYPAPYRVGAFYSQSVSLVRFLSGLKGPEVFTRFLRDGLEDGYAPALRRHYGWGLAELDGRWQRYAFGPAAGG
jgi:hypothetical protein